MAAMEEPQSNMQQLLSSAAGKFKWPDNVLLYCLPPEQELLANRASRLIFQTYLHLSELPFTTRIAPNAISMSPDGAVPFLVFHVGTQPLILTDFEQFVSFLNAQHIGVGCDLEGSDRADQEAYLSLLRVRALPAQHHQTWANWPNISQTLKTSGCGYPWPLNAVLPRLSLFRYMWNFWSTFSRPQADVLGDFELVCTTLSQRLGKDEFFFQSRLTTLDIVVYGHFQALLSVHLSSPELLKILQQHQNLTMFCQRLHQLATAPAPLTELTSIQ